jgi:ubiquinone/menaquinone biosynthesis C-methylase UbiE
VARKVPTSAVIAQYEELPYPHREPADERHRLVQTLGGSLYAINHFCFAARKDFHGFRCLVAGGGTGDCLIYLAEQLRDFDAEIVYLDFSSAARRIAEQRAQIRGLDNITWITDSLLNLPDLDIGGFDFINCSGVLHHLPSTEAGLAAITQVLKDDGGMYLMLYGRYGRRAVYEMQALLREYLPASASIADKITMTRQLLDSLPSTNSFRRDISRWSAEIETDAGLYDLLLHSQDRSFTVPEVYALAESQDLKILGFVGDDGSQYDPANVVADPSVLGHLRSLVAPQRQEIAELLNGDITKHEYKGLFHDAPKIGASMPDGETLNYQDEDGGFRIETNAVTRIAFQHMDGNTSLRDLYRIIERSVPGTRRKQAAREIKALFDVLHPRGYLYLIDKDSQGRRIMPLDELARLASGPRA